MRYTIEYVNQRIGGEQRSIVPMVFRDKLPRWMAPAH
jgi:hypothetical protein